MIADLSWGWPTCTGAKLHAAGATGAIGYAGCATKGKNVSKSRMHDWLDSGLLVALVIENYATDLRKGAGTGKAQATAIVRAAKKLGYDWRSCVLFTGYDTNAHPDDYPTLLAAMEAYAKRVPVPGYYGDSDSIDYLHARHPDWIYWQSASSSFSPRNPTPNAHLHQLVGGAHGLPIDANRVLRTPLRMMGEDEMPTPKELWYWDGLPNPSGANLKDNPNWTPASVLEYAYRHAKAAHNEAGAALKLVADLPSRVADVEDQQATVLANQKKILAALAELAKIDPAVSIPSQDVTVHIEEAK